MSQGWDTVKTWIARLSEEERSAAANGSSWGAKALLAHMAHWNLAVLRALEIRARGEPVPYQWKDLDAQNAHLLQESKSRRWAEVYAEAEEAYVALRGWVERLSEEELAAADNFAWQEGWPLWQTLLGNTYFHYLDHLAGFYREAGETELATTLRAQTDELYAAWDLHWD
jgi:hypothetical protein